MKTIFSLCSFFSNVPLKIRVKFKASSFYFLDIVATRTANGILFNISETYHSRKIPRPSCANIIAIHFVPCGIEFFESMLSSLRTFELNFIKLVELVKHFRVAFKVLRGI